MALCSPAERVGHCIELIDATLSHFAVSDWRSRPDDIRSFRSILVDCALVCSNWYAVAIKILWQGVMRISTPLSKAVDLIQNPDIERVNKYDYESKMPRRKVKLQDLNSRCWKLSQLYIRELHTKDLGALAGLLMEIGTLAQTHSLFPSLQHLDLTLIRRYSAVAANYLIHGKLRTLHLQFHREVDPGSADVIFLDIHKRAPNLREVTIQECPLATPIEERHSNFAKEIKNLHDLASLLLPLRWMDAEVLEALMQLQNLVSLKLESNQFSLIKDVTLPDLKTFLISCRFPSDPHCIFPQLRHLTLIGLDSQLARMFGDFFTSLPVLETLNLSILPTLHIPSASSILPSAYHPPTTLKSVHLEMVLDGKDSDKLTSTNLPQSYWTEMLYSLKAASLTNLQISTDLSVDITDDILHTLAQSWPNLMTIDLASERDGLVWDSPPPLTARAIVCLTEHCRLLTVIGLFVSADLEPLRYWIATAAPDSHQEK